MSPTKLMVTATETFVTVVVVDFVTVVLVSDEALAFERSKEPVKLITPTMAAVTINKLANDKPTLRAT
jgi:hypothetical protein